MTILIDARPAGYAFDGVDKYVNSGTGKALLLKQELADGDRPSAYAIVDDPTGELGHPVWRITAEYPRDYSAGTDKVRCELQPSPINDGYGTVGEQRWSLFTFLLPPEFIFASGATGTHHDLVLAEWHDFPLEPRIPPWTVLLVHDRMELYRANNAVGQIAQYYTRHWRSRPVDTGRWHSVVMRVTWDGDGDDGAMDVWVDQRLIQRESAAKNTFPGTEECYPKNGMYWNFGWPPNIGVSATALWGGFVVADGEAGSFNEFMAEAGYPQWRELERVSGLVAAGGAR